MFALFALAAPTVDAHTLSYSKAKRAAQSRADDIANKRTRVSTLIRISSHQFYVQAKWTRTDPNGCMGCEYNEITGELEDSPTTEYCFVGLKVRLASSRSRRVKTAIQEKVCA